MTVQRERIFSGNSVQPEKKRPVVYWMEREQRLDDNYSFLYSMELAGINESFVVIVFILSPNLITPTLRSIDFTVRGLKEVKSRAEALNIPFIFKLADDAGEEVYSLAKSLGAGAVVGDFNPLTQSREYKNNFSKKSNIAFFEVDSHNIVPCRHVSQKQEFGAYTLRRKIEKLLPSYLVPYPVTEKPAAEIFPAPEPDAISSEYSDDFDLAYKISGLDLKVEPVRGIEPGHKAGMKVLREFIENDLFKYAEDRNDPVKNAQSGLSPYLHHGQISAQTAALEAARIMGYADLKGGFLDEIIVRKELSDNFCLYNPGYDSFEGFPDWAKHSLSVHLPDEREAVYSLLQFEQADTHDRLWNAAQLQMVKTGKMHGYMRMYWAKKILEWSKSPNDAMKTAVYLNDRYSIDGNDPNGYAGCAWAIGGVHDRAWFERPVFGKIRYMNERGCRRKFDVDEYIRTSAKT